MEIGAAKFKAECLSLLDKLTEEGIIITKHGKPVAKLIPIEESNKDLIGRLKNKIEINEDILSTGIKWNAES